VVVSVVTEAVTVVAVVMEAVVILVEEIKKMAELHAEIIMEVAAEAEDNIIR
jgi:hypothetical protein